MEFGQAVICIAVGVIIALAIEADLHARHRIRADLVREEFEVLLKIIENISLDDIGLEEDRRIWLDTCRRTDKQYRKLCDPTLGKRWTAEYFFRLTANLRGVDVEV